LQYLCSLLFETTTNYQHNLETLLTLVDGTQEGSVVVAPEVCLTAYDYENMEAMLQFAPYATQQIQIHSHNKIIILTMLEKKDGVVYNLAKVFYNGEVVYERAKAKLFRFGEEHHYMQEGRMEDFEVIEVAGVKLAVFICFELRFKELWQKSEGADIIAVPSWWGVLRSEHFKIFTKALALMNQCYVMVSNSSDTDMASSSAIISPSGNVVMDDSQSAIAGVIDFREIKKIRRYIVMD